MSIEHVLLLTSILILLSIAASKISSKIGIPSILLFLLIGMLAGSDGPGGIYFDNPQVAQFIGVVALILILFSVGSLDGGLQSIKPILWSGIALSTLAVLITTILISVFLNWTLNLSFQECFLLGSIVSSTDATAAFSLLSSENVKMRPRLKTLIEFESASNDPLAVLLSLGTISWFMAPHLSAWNFTTIFIQQVVMGFAIGIMMGKGMPWFFNQIKLEQKGLYSVFGMGLLFLTYSLCATIGGSGFLAVYIVGLMVGQADFFHKKGLLRFHDGLSWFMQIMVFLTLGLLVFPSQLIQVIGSDLLIAFFLILIARPLSVFISLAFSEFNYREKLMVSWAGLRGAVPIVLATFPMGMGIPNSDVIFNIVFFIVLTSILLQGTTLAVVARWLKVDK